MKEVLYIPAIIIGFDTCQALNSVQVSCDTYVAGKTVI